MRKDYFENHGDLCDYMIDKAQDGYYTVAVLFYEDAMQLLRELMMYEDIDIDAIEIMPPEYNGYGKEYYVSLTDDMFASVEPAYVNDIYLETDADLTLIDGDASSAAIKDIPDYKCREIYIGDVDDIVKDEDNDECEFCGLCNDKLLNDIFDKSELIKNKDGEVVGIKVDMKSVIDYLFS